MVKWKIAMFIYCYHYYHRFYSISSNDIILQWFKMIANFHIGIHSIKQRACHAFYITVSLYQTSSSMHSFFWWKCLVSLLSISTCLRNTDPQTTKKEEEEELIEKMELPIESVAVLLLHRWNTMSGSTVQNPVLIITMSQVLNVCSNLLLCELWISMTKCWEKVGNLGTRIQENACKHNYITMLWHIF